MRPLLYFFVFTLFFLSCGETTQIKKEIYYFDLDGYFQNEINRLNKLNPTILKTISSQGNTEKKELNNINWTTELLIFKEADINKAAWKDAYSADTTHSNEIATLTYRAKEKSLATKEIRIALNPNGSVKKVVVTKQPNKRIFTASAHLVYIPDSGYTIQNDQKLITFDSDSFIVSATFKY